MGDKRLIDAGELIGYLHEKTFIDGDDRSMVYKAIEKQPTVKAEPVKRGRWIPHTKQIVDIDIKLPTECSECGFEEFSAEKYNFCPECGVEMLKRTMTVSLEEFGKKAGEYQPVKHGRWIKHRIEDPKSILHGAVKDTTCSVCSKSTPYNTEYCMHCGAKMDLKEI